MPEPVGLGAERAEFLGRVATRPEVQQRKAESRGVLKWSASYRRAGLPSAGFQAKYERREQGCRREHDPEQHFHQVPAFRALHLGIRFLGSKKYVMTRSP